jgi:hypothetical protein
MYRKNKFINIGGNIMCRKNRFINLKLSAALRIGGFLFASVLALALLPASVKAQNCKDGICANVSSSWDATKKRNVRTLSFSGMPRTKQDYVTHFYNVRGLPYPYPKQVEVWQRNNSFEGIGGGTTVSVQACRRRGVLIKNTYCTNWVTFTIY